MTTINPCNFEQLRAFVEGYNAAMPGPIALLVLTLLVACHGKPPDDGVCRCTPNNVSTTKSRLETKPMDGEALLGALRRHATDVRLGKNPRAIKMADDELRFAVASFCQPCGTWVKDTMRIEEMFPLDRLDDAAQGTCLGLVLRDGTTVYGDARPRACR
ncbi:MAG: hypothetical protein H6Q90_2537 [Deltaproteobacteria bacterium]|nr:hypothetical protein [Deltaproteobacteria bacterium]